VKIFFPLVVLHWPVLMPVAQAERNNALADLMRPPCFFLDDPHCNELPAPSERERFAGFLVLYQVTAGSAE
jgi:hypothetical protein